MEDKTADPLKAPSLGIPVPDEEFLKITSFVPNTIGSYVQLGQGKEFKD